MLPPAKDPSEKYTGGRRIVVTRSIKRLSVILPVEEQNFKVKVVGDKVVKACEIDDPGAEDSWSPKRELLDRCTSTVRSESEDSWSQKKERVNEDDTDLSKNEDLAAEERTESQS